MYSTDANTPRSGIDQRFDKLKKMLEENKNVSMYISRIPCKPAGPFSSMLVVTMRPMTPEQAIRAG